jgi:ribosomal protein S18 acetylase RimI-like enzyme
MQANAHAQSIPTQFMIAHSGLLDITAIGRQQRASFGRDGYDFFTLLTLMLTPGLVRLKATHSGEVVGFVAAEFNRRERCGWIITIGVTPEFSGAGIGTALLLTAENRLAIGTMRLTVRKSNSRAIAVYERAGYTHRGVHRRYYRDGEDGLIMQKSTDNRVQITEHRQQTTD